MRVRFAVSDEPAWRAALGEGAELVPCPGGSLWKRRFWEALYVQLIFPFRFLDADRVFSVSPIFPALLGSRNVVMIHDVAYRRFPAEAGLPARLYLRAMYRLAALLARRIVTISRFSASEIEDAYGVPRSRIAVLPNSVPELVPLPGDEADRRVAKVAGKAPFFLYVGISRYRKNLPTLLAAFAEASKAMPGLRLVLAGKEDARFVDVACIVARLGIADRVVRAGFVSLEDKAALMQRAIALVQPSLYEGFGLQLLEAQRMGLPVIASGIPALREVAGGAALFVDDPLDVSGFADAMRAVAEDSTLSARLAAAGHDNYPRYSWESNVAALTDLLAS